MATQREVAIILKAVDRASKTLRGIGSAAGAGFQRIAQHAEEASRGLIAVGAAATLALGIAVNTAANFQQEMANTASVVTATDSELQTMTDHAREMGRTTVFSARESAQAMYFLGSAGLDVNQIVGALSGTLELAAATQADLAFSSRTVVSTLSAYNLAAEESSRVSNVFAAAIGGSQATIDRLATSLSYIGPIAESINMSLESTVGVLGLLYNAGIDASTAGTAVRQAVAKLLDPSKEATETLNRLRVSVLDSEGALRPLVDIVRDLETAGLTTADAMRIFGVRAGPAMLTLVNQGADAIEAFTKEITGTNKAAEMAEKQLDTFKGQTRLLRSALEELQITIGDALIPTLREYTGIVTRITNETSAWANENPKLSKALVGIAASTGVAVLGFGGLLLSTAKITTAVTGLNTAIGTAGIGGLGLIAGIGALAAAILALQKREQDYLDHLKKVKPMISEAYNFQNVMEGNQKAAKEFSKLNDQIIKEQQDIRFLQEKIKEREDALFGMDPGITDPIHAYTKALEIAQARLIQLQEQMDRFLTARPGTGKPTIPGEIDDMTGVDIDRQKKLAAELLKERQRLTMSEREFNIAEAEQWAAERIKIAEGNADLIAQIEQVKTLKIGQIWKDYFDSEAESREQAYEMASALLDEHIREIEAADKKREAIENKRLAAMDAISIATLEAQGKMEEAALVRLANEVEAYQAAGVDRLTIEEYVAAQRAAISKRYEEEIIDKRQELSDRLYQQQLSMEQELADNINSLRESTFQMEQRRIEQMQQGYVSYIQAAIRIGRDLFSQQEGGWLHGIAGIIRYVTRMIAGYMKGRALEKLKQADQAQTTAQFLFNHGKEMLALAGKFALLGDIGRATLAGAQAIAAGQEAARLEVKAKGLQVQAGAMMTAAVAVEAAGEVAASGIDMAAESARNAAREQDEIARANERRYETEYRLKQRILELEGRTAEAERMALEHELAGYRESGINESLISRYEQLAGAGLPAGAGATGAVTGGATGGYVPGGAVVYQTNYFAGFTDTADETQLRELAKALQPFNEEISDQFSTA